MKKFTKLSIQWFYNLIANGECDFVDFKEQLEDKNLFGKSLRSFSPHYEELARDVVAFANKKGGFIFIGIIDGSKEINQDFAIEDEAIFKLIRQIQDRTIPAITLIPHRIRVDNKLILVLEIPFTTQLHRTSKGEYLIRNFDGNRAIDPHEFSTLQAEKGLIIYDQKTWDLPFESNEKDQQGNPIPGWQDIKKTRRLYLKIKEEKPESPYLKNTQNEFNETLGLVKEEAGKYLPTTTGVLFIGNQKALKEIPYNQIKYVRYNQDGTYAPYEYTGDLITIADECFAQLKSEINLKEFNFGLFREYIEDYPEIVLRELLINSIAHRDYSRQQVTEIRKYPGYIEFETPGTFPQGITKENYLRKTNPRNPNIIDVFRELNYAEKAGSGFDKVFTALLAKGKSLPQPEETDFSVIFRIEAETYSEKLIELSHIYKNIKKADLGLDMLLILNAIYTGKKMTFKELLEYPYINSYQLKRLLDELEEIQFIEATGQTSGQKFIIHKSRLVGIKDETQYLKQKKQEKVKQIEAIMRYLSEFDEIDNEAARSLLQLPAKEIYYVSRLFNEMVEKNLIKIMRRDRRKTYYGKK